MQTISKIQSCAKVKITPLISWYIALYSAYILFYYYFLKAIKIFFSFFKTFIYFLAALGLRCCTLALSSCREMVHELLIAAGSLVAEQGL